MQIIWVYYSPYISIRYRKNPKLVDKSSKLLSNRGFLVEWKLVIKTITLASNFICKKYKHTPKTVNPVSAVSSYLLIPLPIHPLPSFYIRNNWSMGVSSLTEEHNIQAHYKEETNQTLT